VAMKTVERVSHRERLGHNRCRNTQLLSKMKKVTWIKWGNAWQLLGSSANSGFCRFVQQKSHSGVGLVRTLSARFNMVEAPCSGPA
jgi:hypothetical protein